MGATDANMSFHDSIYHSVHETYNSRVWNALPPELRHDISFGLGLFRRKLMSHL